MLSIDFGLIVIFVIVWILLIVLNRIFYNPVQKAIHHREQKIDKDRNKGENAQARVERILSQIEKELKSARSSSLATKENFEQEALKEKERILGEISQECRSQVQDAKNELNQKVAVLQKKLEKSSEAFAEQIEKKLLPK